MTTVSEAKAELVLASRILAHNQILDVFGHVSIRHPDRPDRFFLSRSRSPSLVEIEDLIEFDLACEPVGPDTRRVFLERVIHGEIYRARPDVHAVSHYHAEAIMPFCVAGVPVRPVTHVGATIGREVPIWNQRDAFGDTNLLVSTAEQGASLAAALGQNWTVLLTNHGGVSVGTGIREMVFRSINLRLNAEIQRKAVLMGSPDFLTDGEIDLAAKANLGELVLARAWEYWCSRLE